MVSRNLKNTTTAPCGETPFFLCWLCQEIKLDERSSSTGTSQPSCTVIWNWDFHLETRSEIEIFVWKLHGWIKFIYSEKTTKIRQNLPVDLNFTLQTPNKMGKIAIFLRLSQHIWTLRAILWFIWPLDVQNMWFIPKSQKLIFQEFT